MLKIKTGPTHSPLRLLFQGQEGVGKTTWAAGCPGALFLTCEDGGGLLDYARVECSKWDDLRGAVWELIANGAQGYSTVVIDTIDSFERLLWLRVCEDDNKKTIEDVGGGFGKGYTRAAEHMGQLQRDLDTLRQKHGMNVILLAHVHVRPFNDPTGPAYDRYEMRLHKGTSALWSAWADAVLFACFDATVLKAGKKGRVDEANVDKLEKGKATKVRRVVYTSKEAAFDAKNRHNLPEELPLEWDAFAEAIGWGRRKPQAPAVKVEHAPAGEGHHESFDDAERKWFMSELGEMSLSYANIRAWCLAKGKPKPSAMTSAVRRDCLSFLRSDAGKANLSSFLTGVSAK